MAQLKNYHSLIAAASRGPFNSTTWPPRNPAAFQQRSLHIRCPTYEKPQNRLQWLLIRTFCYCHEPTQYTHP